MTDHKNKNRNDAIIAFHKAHPDWSYQIIGHCFGVTRTTIAGVLFRHRHPSDQLVKSGNGHRNKTGTGFTQASYYPTFTARNSRGVDG